MRKILILSVSLLLLLNFAIADDDSNDELEELLEQIEEDEEQCVEECDDSDICKEQYENDKDACKEIKDQGIVDCKNKSRRERGRCDKQVNEDYRDCRKAAREAREECKENTEGNEAMCILDCKLGICDLPLGDSDGDRVLDFLDNCPLDFNPEQEDSDGNGIGDVCEDIIPEGVLCCAGDHEDGGCFFAVDIESCRAQGGAVMDCLGGEGLPGDVIISELVNFTSTTFNNTDSALVNLTRDVANTGINNTAYVPGSYVCADFAGDLERNLTAAGYDATFTAYWCYGGAGNPPSAAHAVTDVHLDDGRTVFIEPQTGRIVDLDFDNDGEVEVNNGGYTPGAGVGTTDDNCKISVFDNRADAVTAGVPGA